MALTARLDSLQQETGITINSCFRYALFWCVDVLLPYRSRISILVTLGHVIVCL